MIIMSNVREINEKEFEEIVKNNKFVFVDFFGFS